MNRYYLSLCRGLTGYYVAFDAPDEDTVRHHAAEYFGRLWCTVYDADYFVNRILSRFPRTNVINADNPVVLESWEWE